jgi:hypothetical protein
MDIIAVTASLDVSVRREDAGRDQDRVRGQNRDGVSPGSGSDDVVVSACPRSPIDVFVTGDAVEDGHIVMRSRPHPRSSTSTSHES